MRKLLVAALGALSVAVWMAPAPASAGQMHACSYEGGVCEVPYPTRVMYGANGRYVWRDVRGHRIPCNNGVFGDPAPGVPKVCSYEVRGRGYGGYGYGGKRYRGDY